MKSKIKLPQKSHCAYYAMLFLPVLLVFIYRYIPMVGVSIAFMDYNPGLGFKGSEFVGFDNFRTLFMNPAFSRAIKNTIIISLWKIVLGLLFPLIFSLLLNEIQNSIHKRVAQTIVYMPHFISWVLAAGMVVDVLSPTGGSINVLLESFGIKPIFFLGSNKWFRPVLIISELWKGFGWSTIIYMATLTSIDQNLYEAAAIDGADRWKQTIHITLPGMASIIALKAVLSLDDILNAGFDQVYNLLSSVTLESGDILDTLVYRMGMEQAQFGISTAAGLFKSLIGATLVVLSRKLADKLTGYKVF